MGSANSDRAWVDDISLPPHKVLVATSSPNQAAFEMSLAPNPSSGKALLQVELPAAQRIRIGVFDCLGHSVQTFAASDQRVGGTYSVTLDLRDMASGLYFVQVQGETGTRVLKFVKE